MSEAALPPVSCSPRSEAICHKRINLRIIRAIGSAREAVQDLERQTQKTIAVAGM